MNLITIPPPNQPGPAHTRLRAAGRAAALVSARIRHGRAGILALRTLGTVAAAEAALHSGAGPAPATGTLAGLAVWYLAGASADLAPPPQDTP